jgi:subtilase family serine protease
MKHAFESRSARTGIRRLAMALAAALAVQGVAGTAQAQQTAAAAQPWVALGHAVHLDGAAPGGAVDDAEPVSVTVALKLRNKDLLDSYVKELFRPGSPSYHQWMSSEQSTAYFSPTQEQAQAVADYLASKGFSNVQVAPNRLVVTADGTVGAARNAFRTGFGRFARHGRTGIANTDDIQLPAALGGQVQAVLGLQTLDDLHTFSRTPAKVQAGVGTAKGVAGDGTVYYFPREFATIYHAGSTPAGTGTAAAIIAEGTLTATVNDLKQFESDYGISPVPTSVVTVGRASSDNSGEGEWALDAQAIVGISGGVKSLTFYAANSMSSSNLLQAINRAVSDNTAKVIDMSWGGCESEVGVGWADSAFETAVTHGQTFSASSGDNGAYGCGASENGSYGTTLGVSYPASSPYVIAIGGTTLTTDSGSNYVSEASWPYSGGGTSGSESKPSWQTNVSGSRRQLPDLAFDADWDKSAIAYYLGSGTSSAGYYVNGGTSLASPLFVGAWARLESSHGNQLGFAPKAIYAYAGNAAASLPLQDVSTGDNGHYSALAGWDEATGWGSFDIQAVDTFITGTPGFISASNQ